MALYTGKHINKVDRKGRVSVPADFRAELAGEAFQGIIVRPSLFFPCLEGCGRSVLEKYQDEIDQYHPLTSKHASAATAIFAQAVQVQWDGEGRVVLPNDLLAYAGITERATFVGNSRVFEIWAPDRFAAIERQRIEEARESFKSLQPRPGQ